MATSEIDEIVEKMDSADINHDTTFLDIWFISAMKYLNEPRLADIVSIYMSLNMMTSIDETVIIEAMYDGYWALSESERWVKIECEDEKMVCCAEFPGCNKIGEFGLALSDEEYVVCSKCWSQKEEMKKIELETLANGQIADDSFECFIEFIGGKLGVIDSSNVDSPMSDSEYE